MDALATPCHRDRANEYTVDGFNANGNVTVINAAMEIAHQRATDATLEQIKKPCPTANLIDSNGFFGCLSECKQTDSDQHCCKGTYKERFGGMACPESSLFLKELAPKVTDCPSTTHVPLLNHRRPTGGLAVTR